jgi:MFS family permease
LFNIGLLGYFTFSIDHLTACGIPFPLARFLGSLPMILSIFLAPAAGLIIHRFGLRWSLAVIGCFVSGLAVWLLYFSNGGHPVVWSVVLGVGISLVAPAVFTIAGQVVSPGRLGTGYGIMNTLFNVGMFAGIPVLGKARDMTGDYRLSFALMAALLLVGSVLSLFSAKMLSE